MKDDITYNRPNNEVMVRSDGDLIYVICNKESQQEKVIKKMINDNCILESYEEWDDDSDKKWILIFKILDEYDLKPELN